MSAQEEEERVKISVRLPSRFQELTDQIPQLSDCILKLGEKQIPTHRIVLAKNSPWFHDHFKKNPKPENDPIVVEMNDIDPNAMGEFLEILYKNYLKINLNNIVQLLKIAYLYQFPHISRILRVFYIDANTNHNDAFLMNFAENFIKAGLIDDAIALAPKIAFHFVRAERGDKNETITLHEIYKSLSPQVFAAVIKERRKILELEEEKKKQEAESSKINNNNNINIPSSSTNTSINKPTLEEVNNSILQNMSEYTFDRKLIGIFELVSLIEDFVKVKGASNLTEDDKGFLADAMICKSLVKGLDEQVATNFMNKFDCEWFPDKYYRLHAKRMLERKQKAIKKFEDVSSYYPDQSITNRWYVLNWLRKIKENGSDSEIPLIEFIRTFGGSVNAINPVKYGLIKISSSEPLALHREAENAFISDPNKYFFTGYQSENDKTNPFIKFDLGENAIFRPFKLYFDSRITTHKASAIKLDSKQSYDYHSHTSELKLTTTNVVNNEREITTNRVIFPVPENPKQYDYPKIDGSNEGAPFSEAKFEQVKNDKMTSTFRVTTLELLGTFNPKDPKKTK